MRTRRSIGLLGGTFDPVHVGHLALARSAMSALALTQIVFLPSGQPWQKPALATPAQHRLRMLELAIAGEPHFAVDPRELERAGPSYTIDTLIELRAELGPQPALVLILGSDQFRNLPTWHRWPDLLDYAHIAATQRESVGLDALPAELEAWLDAHGRDHLPDAAHGTVTFFRMPPVAVSSSVLRAQLVDSARTDGRPSTFDGRRNDDRLIGLVPPAVLDYIAAHDLYH